MEFGIAGEPGCYLQVDLRLDEDYIGFEVYIRGSYLDTAKRDLCGSSYVGLKVKRVDFHSWHESRRDAANKLMSMLLPLLRKIEAAAKRVAPIEAERAEWLAAQPPAVQSAEVQP